MGLRGMGGGERGGKKPTEATGEFGQTGEERTG